MSPNDLQTVLDQARRALRGEAVRQSLQILPRSDGAVPVALLVTIDRETGDLIVPLRHGHNLVGRSCGGTKPFGTWPQPYAVEGEQWAIDCASGKAEVWDVASTNLSILIPAQLVSQVELGRGARGFSELFRARGAMPLPHPNVDRTRNALHECDLLRSYYASFVFGWM